jgi:hypothetical protein
LYFQDLYEHFPFSIITGRGGFPAFFKGGRESILELCARLIETYVPLFIIRSLLREIILTGEGEKAHTPTPPFLFIFFSAFYLLLLFLLFLLK